MNMTVPYISKRTKKNGSTNTAFPYMVLFVSFINYVVTILLIPYGSGHLCSMCSSNDLEVVLSSVCCARLMY